MALSWFPASSLSIQTLISQSPHNAASTKQLHCSCTALLNLVGPSSNKRNLVEVQLEKSKLAVGHFDNLHSSHLPPLDVQQHSSSLCPLPRKQSTSKELNKAACRAVKHQSKENSFNSVLFPDTTPFPRDNSPRGQGGVGGDPRGAGMARRPAFLLTHVVVW